MIIRELPRGDDVAGLLYYLYGPGRADEHLNPHLVTGFRHPAELEPPLHGTRRDFRHLTGLMRQPVEAQAPNVSPRPVWHTIARAAPNDRVLADEDWAEIAGRIMHVTGLSPYGQEEEGVRWVAIRHAADHIHIVATLARQDGRAIDLNNSWFKLQHARREIEQDYGLQMVGPGDGTAARRPTRGEREKAKRHGWREAPRTTLKRAVSEAAAGASAEKDFFARLGAFASPELGPIVVRKRFSTLDPTEVTGYAVGLEGHRGVDGPILYGGGSLAADLSLPKIRARFQGIVGVEPQDGGGVGRIAEGTVRATLRASVRAAAVAGSEEAFFASLEDAGLSVRKRFSEIHPGLVTGYSVGLPGQHDATGRTRTISGGRLADDLTLPRLRRRWAADDSLPSADGSRITPYQRRILWEDAARVASAAAETVTALADVAPDRACDAAWAAADILNVCAQELGSAECRQAARAFDRAAREPYRRLPAPTPTGGSLRTVARALVIGGLMDRRSTAWIMTLTGVLRLVGAVSQLRRSQGRLVQAESARQAAEHLTAIVERGGRHHSISGGEGNSPGAAHHDFPSARQRFSDPQQAGPKTRSTSSRSAAKGPSETTRITH